MARQGQHQRDALAASVPDISPVGMETHASELPNPFSSAGQGVAATENQGVAAPAAQSTSAPGEMPAAQGATVPMAAPAAQAAAGFIAQGNAFQDGRDPDALEDADGQPQEDLLAPRNLIMVVHASVGSGHRSAAESIAQAFEMLKEEGYPDLAKRGDVEIEVVDILSWGRHVFNGEHAASMFIGPTRPLYDLTWRYTFTGRILWGGGTVWSRIMYAPFTEYIRKRRPLAVVATHITAANSAVAARMLTGQDFPVVCVPTDYETEGLWPHKAADLFCVATESMAETLRARKVTDDRIKITGIPTRQDYRVPKDKALCRQSFDLPAYKKVALVLAGAHISKPYERFRDAIGVIWTHANILDDFHFVVVTGNDTAFQGSLEAKCAEYHTHNITVVGYVENMADLMAASDLVICKAGGLTVTECLCSRTPMILLGKAYGQEKINVEMLTSRSAALRVTTSRELLEALSYLMEHPQSIQAMLINGDFLRRVDAARDICKATLELADKRTNSHDMTRKRHFLWFYLGHKPAHVR